MIIRLVRLSYKWDSLFFYFKQPKKEKLKKLYNFPMLKAIAKMAKSILMLSTPKCRNRSYCLLDFVCPKTASGSMGLRLRCINPSSEFNSSRAFCLYRFSLWLISMTRFSFALWHKQERCCLCTSSSVQRGKEDILQKTQFHLFP